MVKNRTVKFLCSDDQYIRIVAKAERLGFLSLSEYLRIAALFDDLVEENIKEAYRRLRNECEQDNTDKSN